jgi:hypothetical protein
MPAADAAAPTRLIEADAFLASPAGSGQNRAYRIAN